jgi:hypothetical protein
MQYRRCALGTCWFASATALTLAVAGGGCASPLTGPVTGLVEPEPHKARQTKPAKSGAPEADEQLRSAELAPASAPSDAILGLTGDQTPLAAGSGFPPLGATPSSAPRDADFAALATELQALGTLPPSEQQALLADLKQSDPALWPQLVRQFRAAMAYRSRGQGSGVGGQEPELGDGRSNAGGPGGCPAASLATRSAATADEAPNRVADADTIGAAPKTIGTPAAEALPAAPALRPPLKARAQKSGDQVAAAKLPDSGSAMPVAKVAADSSVQSDDRQVQLTKAILAMEGESAGNTAAADEIARQIRLRMMYLAAGRRDDALRPIPNLSPAQQEFWTKEIYGLATYLDAGGATDNGRKAAEAALHLREAAARIGELASPVVRNLAFCKEVTSFGVFKRFAKDEFKAGDEALLYCEIDNLKAESTDKGFRTSVKSSYQILDAHGQRVAEQEFPASEDLCTSQRRDFFIPYFIGMPKRISAGAYTLQLTVEDTQTHKTGQASIQFAVK